MLALYSPSMQIPTELKEAQSSVNICEKIADFHGGHY